MERYYTMKECFDECGDEDVPFLEDRFNTLHRESKRALIDYDHLALPICDIFSDRWQIKRAGPKILTAPEYCKGVCMLDSAIYKDVRRAFEDGDKNGQLKQWLNHKKMRDFVENLIGDPVSYRHDAARALDSVKPLGDL